MKTQLSFSVSADYIVDTARFWFFEEGKSYESVETLLLSCMQGTDETEESLKSKVRKIVFGQATLTGCSNDGIEYVELDDTDHDLMDEYIKLRERYNRLLDQYDSVGAKYIDTYTIFEALYDDDLEAALDVADDRPEYTDLIDSWAAKLDLHLEDSDEACSLTCNLAVSDEVNEMLEMHHAEPATLGYGWLEPDGTFHPVEFAEHQSYACRVLKDRGWEAEFLDSLTNRHPSDRLDLHRLQSGDYLCEEKGWILLHNPNMGKPIATTSAHKRITKQQAEFLYDYFMQYNMRSEANFYTRYL